MSHEEIKGKRSVGEEGGGVVISVEGPGENSIR